MEVQTTTSTNSTSPLLNTTSFESTTFSIVMQTMMYSIICCVGVTGNLSVIVNVIKNAELHTASCFLMATLALSDLLQSVVWNCGSTAFDILRQNEMSAIGCGFIGTLLTASTVCSTLLTGAMAFDKYNYIVHPMCYEHNAAVRRAACCVVVSVIVAVGFCLQQLHINANFVFSDLVHMCIYTQANILYVSFFLVVYIPSQIVIMFAHIKIWTACKRHLQMDRMLENTLLHIKNTALQKKSESDEQLLAQRWTERRATVIPMMQQLTVHRRNSNVHRRVARHSICISIPMHTRELDSPTIISVQQATSNSFISEASETNISIPVHPSALTSEPTHNSVSEKELSSISSKIKIRSNFSTLMPSQTISRKSIVTINMDVTDTVDNLSIDRSNTVMYSNFPVEYRFRKAAFLLSLPSVIPWLTVAPFFILLLMLESYPATTWLPVATRVMAHICFTFSPCLNPFIYGLTKKDFRAALFSCCRLKLNQVAPIGVH